MKHTHTEEDGMYTITVRRSWYGPKTTVERLDDGTGRDWTGSKAEAQAKIAELDSTVYYTIPGEAGRPEYSVTYQRRAA